jgi:hypothetical protein
MTSTSDDDVVAAVRDFVDRIDALDPPPGEPAVALLHIRSGQTQANLALSTPVARALVAALKAYRDPRDRGRCVHCGGRRVDEHFLCLDCGRPNGLFGQIVLERAERYTEPPQLEPPRLGPPQLEPPPDPSSG